MPNTSIEHFSPDHLMEFIDKGEYIAYIDKNGEFWCPDKPRLSEMLLHYIEIVENSPGSVFESPNWVELGPRVNAAGKTASSSNFTHHKN